MIRETSLEAYYYLKDSGKLSAKRWVVYDGLFKCGPATGMELLSRMGRKSSVDSQVRARLSELAEMGLVKEIGQKVCQITGMRVIEWDVTARIHPLKREKKPKERSDVLKRELMLERERCALLAEKWNAPMAAYAIRNQGDL